MIKVFAFDLVGVLVREKQIEMTPEEEKIERLFGPNKSDGEFLTQAQQIVSDNITLMKIAENVIDKLYEVINPNLFIKLKEKYPNIKIIIATNHISYIRHYISKAFGIDNIDDIFISAEMNKIKPNNDFYEEIVEKNNCRPEEILFMDDNQENVNGALHVGLNSFKVEKGMDLYEEIVKWMKENNIKKTL